MTQAHLDLETLDGPGEPSGSAVERALVLTILAHPSAARVGARAVLPLDRPGARVGLSRGEPSFGGPRCAPDPLLSPFVSRKAIVLEASADGGVALDARAFASRVEVDGVAVQALALGPAHLDAGAVLQLGTHVALFLQREPALREPPSALTDDGLVGVSAAIAAVRRTIARVADKPGAVLVRGETGTGKDVVARALHLASARRERAFVPVNVAAIPGSLVASQLFGHARGAFSGAERAHDGYFAQAAGGTLFLDEIADAAPEVQAALLRVLETGEVQPVGARAVARVDVRVVAATDGDLEAAVAAGRFRAPLFYRLATHELTVPPLRARRADIGLLLVTFLAEALDAVGRHALLEPAATEAAPWLPAALVAALARHPWPGNVRQLRSVAHAMASETQARLALDDPRWSALTTPARATTINAPVTAPKFAPEGSAARAPKRPDDDAVEAALVAHDYRLAAAAAHLGVSRPTMNALVDRHPRLRRAQKIDADEIGGALDAEAAGGELAWRALRVSKDGLRRRAEALGLAQATTPRSEDDDA